MPEVKTYFSRVGTAEVATDPMPPNISDGYIMLKDHKDWPDLEKTKAELAVEIEKRLESIPGNAFEISQPIQLRRSEEHTSELQSLMRISYAVFCLKKKSNIPILLITYYHSPSIHIQIFLVCITYILQPCHP